MRSDERLEDMCYGDGSGFYYRPEFVPPREPSTDPEPPLQSPPGVRSRKGQAHSLCSTISYITSAKMQLTVRSRPYRATKKAVDP